MAFKINVRKAERRKARLRLALCGASGGGKTYGAITIAKQLGGRFVVLDTEKESADLFSDLGEFDVIPMRDSYEVENFIETIKFCEKDGYTTLIIDSLSHAWSGVGGVLDQHDKITASSSSKNSFVTWKKMTPIQNLLVDTILKSPMHIICTMRSKMEHDQQINSDGKKVVVKLGLAPVQRNDIEYEFTTVFDMSPDGNIASCSKDRTRIFQGKNFLITEETGKKLLEWLETGKGEDDEINEAISEIRKCNNLVDLRRTFEPYFLKFSRSTRQAEIIAAKDQVKSFIEDAQKKVIGNSEDIPL